MTECARCDGTGWVCENHPEQPWAGVSTSPNACECGAGEPCLDCNSNLNKTGFEGGVIISSVDPIPDGQRVH